ncbi:MAG: hypothetical protein Kow0013_23760 [Pararhodobacter sp.]
MSDGPSQRPERPHVPTWRIILAAILDFATVFGFGGYVIARFTGNLTSTGFRLEGAPAFALFALIIGYFLLAPRMGGTLWQRILRARRPRGDA